MGSKSVSLIIPVNNSLFFSLVKEYTQTTSNLDDERNMHFEVVWVYMLTC